MRRRDRMNVMIEAMRRIAAREADWVTFADAAQPGNYVQLAEFGRDGVTYVEVTCRDWDAPGVQPLTPEQVEALAALGFGKARNPNHTGFFAWPEPVCLAKLCETAFTILGSPQHFDLRVARMGFWHVQRTDEDRMRTKEEAMAAWSAREGRPCPVAHPEACNPTVPLSP